MPSDLFDSLRVLDLNEGEYAVFGSGTLAIRGLIDDPADLDVLCRGDAWEKVSGLGEMVELDDGNYIASLDGGLLTFGRTWAFGNSEIDEMIDTAEWIEGLPFVRIPHVVAYKQHRQSDRDIAHLELIRSAGLG